MHIVVLSAAVVVCLNEAVKNIKVDLLCFFLFHIRFLWYMLICSYQHG